MTQTNAEARPVIALGTFDGLHPGHRKVILTCVELAKELASPAAVYTFLENPRSLFGASPKAILTNEEKEKELLALGIDDSRKALEAQQQVTAVTNELLKKNADMLKIATVETAKESERGVVDIETLQHTNQQLISTLDEVLQIQSEGAQKRQAAEVELRRIEGELKQKLLDMRG